MNRLSEEMLALGANRNAIRELFEYGKMRSAEIGAENVYDFALGNPSAPPPPRVNEVAIDLLRHSDPMDIHGYTSAQGDGASRRAIAQDLNGRFGTNYDENHIYMTAGAAPGLCYCFKGLTCPGDDYVVIAPFFMEYKVFIQATGGTVTVVPPEIEAFQIDFDALESAITPKTKGVVVNSPNNPSGAIYSVQTAERLGQLLQRKSEEYGHVIWLISDEPYREVVYDGALVPWLPSYYDNTIVCYSYSKSLSIPGQRIGYVLVPPTAEAWQNVYYAVAGAGRCMGHVSAPGLFQRVAAQCTDMVSDVTTYTKNRNLFLAMFQRLGIHCVAPGGAFYLFPRTPIPNAVEFCKRAQAHDILIVPGDGFACPGHTRISYCVPTERVERSMPAFERLMAEYR